MEHNESFEMGGGLTLHSVVVQKMRQIDHLSQTALFVDSKNKKLNVNFLSSTPTPDFIIDIVHYSLWSWGSLKSWFVCIQNWLFQNKWFSVEQPTNYFMLITRLKQILLQYLQSQHWISKQKVFHNKNQFSMCPFTNSLGNTYLYSQKTLHKVLADLTAT